MRELLHDVMAERDALQSELEEYRRLIAFLAQYGELLLSEDQDGVMWAFTNCPSGEGEPIMPILTPSAGTTDTRTNAQDGQKEGSDEQEDERAGCASGDPRRDGRAGCRTGEAPVEGGSDVPRCGVDHGGNPDVHPPGGDSGAFLASDHPAVGRERVHQQDQLREPATERSERSGGATEGVNTPEGQGCAVVPAKAREESDTGGGCNTNPAGTDDQRASRPVSPPTTERYCCAVAPDTRRRDAIGATCQLPWGHEGIHQCVGKTGGQTWPKPTPPPERCPGLGRYGRHKWYLRQPGCHVCRACGALDYSTKTTPPKCRTCGGLRKVPRDDDMEMASSESWPPCPDCNTPPPAGVETGPIDWAGTPREAFARAAEYCEVMGGTGWLIGARQDDPNRYGYEERQAYLHAARWMRANEAKYTAPPSQPPACAGEDHTHTADHECNENNNQELD